MQREQEKEVEKAAAFQEQKRLALQNAMQERKIQEKLYENAFEEFKQEENARESKEIDELVSYVYGQRRKEDQAAGQLAGGKAVFQRQRGGPQGPHLRRHLLLGRRCGVCLGQV